MPVAYTTTYWKIKEMSKPIKLIQGGQGAGKNYALALLLLERQDSKTITILTDTYPNLKDGVISDLELIFNSWGMDFNDYLNKQDMTAYWGNTKIQFRHADNNKPQKGKGPRRDILYINEGNRLGWSAVENYIARSKEVYVDFNPDFEFWAHKELEPREDCEKIIVTYRDNEMCPENEVRFIESRKNNEQWYRVYGLGLTGTYSDRRVYSSFTVIDEIPKGVKRIPSGMDFGQSPDPTILVDAYIENDFNLYLDEVFCENNLMPEKIKGSERMSVVDKMEEVNHLKNWLTIGDSSGKVEILDLRKHGYNIRGVKKGTGSQYKGIKILKAYNIFVTKRSENLIKGFENWFWKIDHNGKIIPEPDGHEPDGLAATRYIVMAKNHW